MSLQVASGTVSHLRVVSSTHGNISAKHGGTIRTTHTTQFRIGTSLIEMTGSINIVDGDDVAVVGPVAGAVIQGVALYDLKAGLLFIAPVSSWILFSGVGSLLVAALSFITLVLAASPISLGLIPTLIGGILIWFYRRESRRLVEALSLLQSAARTSAWESPALAAFTPIQRSALQIAAWSFRVISILLGLALTLEIAAALYLEGTVVLSPLLREILLVVVPISIFWFASTWIFGMVKPGRHELSAAQPVAVV